MIDIARGEGGDADELAAFIEEGLLLAEGDDDVRGAGHAIAAPPGVGIGGLAGVAAVTGVVALKVDGAAGVRASGSVIVDVRAIGEEQDRGHAETDTARAACAEKGRTETTNKGREHQAHAKEREERGVLGCGSMEHRSMVVHFGADVTSVVWMDDLWLRGVL